MTQKIDNLFSHINSMLESSNESSVEIVDNSNDDKAEEYDVELGNRAELTRNQNMDDVKKTIINDVITPFMKQETTKLSRSSSRWRMLGNCMDTCAKVVAVGSTVTAFGAGYFNDMNLVYLSGIAGIANMALTQMADYSRSESVQRATELNNILAYLGLSKLPIVDAE